MEFVAEVAAYQQGDDLDYAAWGAEEEGLLVCEAKADDQLGEEV